MPPILAEDEGLNFGRWVGSDRLPIGSQRGQDSQVWLVGSVLLSELWKSPETRPELHRGRGQSLSKPQDI